MLRQIEARLCVVLLLAGGGSVTLPTVPSNSSSSEAQLVARYKPKPKGGRPDGGGPGTRLTGGENVGATV